MASLYFQVGYDVFGWIAQMVEMSTTGSEDGSIHAWDVATGSSVGKFSGHSGPAQVVKFNPRYLMMASGCANVVSLNM